MAPESNLLPINVFPLVIGDLLQRRLDAGIPPSDFVFVQIGAHDGFHFDPVRPYVKKYHWKGILVEPQPEVYRQLVANYADEPQLIFENAAVAHRNGMANLYTFKKSDALPAHASMLASFYREALVHNGHGYQGEIEEIQVPTVSLITLLTRNQMTKMDFLQIDTEGFDYEILKLLEFCPIKPEIIHFESAFLNAVLKVECGELLHRMGYRALTVGIDTIAYRQVEDDFAEVFANKGH